MKIDAFAQMAKVWETWLKIADDSFARFRDMAKEAEKLEATNVERANAAIDEAAKLQKDGVAYAVELGAQWRKISLEAFQDATARS